MRISVGSRWGVLVSGAAALAVAVTVLVSTGGSAHGSEAQRCERFAHQSQVRKELVSGTGRRISVIGDSYAAGFGLADPGDSWPSRLPGRVVVYGFSGSGFSRAASPCKNVSYDRRAHQALSSKPALVVVEGGLNDYDQPTAEIRAGFRRLLGALGKVPVLVVGPAHAPVRASGAVRVDAILRREAALTRTPYLSMIMRRFSYLRGNLHLTLASHRLFGDYVAQALRARRL
ncbi:MAG: hypothetical protein JWP74_3717 [Marmoricola sp.]|nr:hypothetical protein [Marmoricola sp.]